MNAQIFLRRPIRWETWALNAEADRRFRRIFTTIAIPVIALAIIIPFWHLQSVQKGGGTPQGSPQATTVRLLPSPPAPIAKKREEPKPVPKPEEKPQPAPKPEVKPPQVAHAPRTAERPKKPAAPRVSARERAQHIAAASGLNALSTLSDSDFAVPTTPRPLVSGQLTTRGGTGSPRETLRAFERSAGSTADAGVAGVGAAPVTRAQSGTGVGSRRTATVTSAIGFGRDKSRPGDSGRNLHAARTLSEIQLVFDRNKAAFYSLYNAALRRNPNEQGKIVVSLTIAPNGSVTDCHMVYSNTGDKTLEQQVVARVKMMNFGAKAVPSFTYPNYPIHFVPPS